EYLPTEIITNFTKETGIKVNYSTFDSNEAMYTKVKLLKGKGYDLVVPSTYYVSLMAEDDLLMPLDKTKISAFSDLDSSIMNQDFDKENQYSVPYMWGSTGLGYNAELIDGKEVTHWTSLWNEEFADQIILTNDVRDVFGMALKLLGYSVNSTNPQEIKAAYEKLKTLHPAVVVYNSDAPHIPLLSGEVSVGMQWNGSNYRAQLENPNIHYVYPSEGALFWMDNLVIPKGSENADAAYAFINYLYQPENQAILVKEIGYAAPNLKLMDHLPAQLRESTTIFPTKEDKEKGEFLGSVGDARELYEKYWLELKQ
ncbi:extracellular solute-binding protein, partial [Vibrio sp.]|nr:extracellular solute-binding protein [Vibrio sp.]